MAEAAKPDFEAVRKSRVYEAVARQMERLILDKLRPGDKLPPERQLMQMFGVSRSSIRDAIRTLESVGLVEPRQGAGTVVREIANDSVVNPLTNVLLRKRKLVAELLDVRKIIEPPLAARAAANAASESIARMERILERQSACLRRGELPIDEDAEFHYTIALAADNSVVLKVLDVLMDLLRQTRERSLQAAGRPQKSLAGHRRILAAIKRGDAAAAEVAMRQHIQEVEVIILKKL